MIREKSKRKCLWPNFFIQNASRIIAEHGREKFCSKGQFKKEREFWIASVFLLGLTSKNNKLYYIDNDKNQELPDVVAIYFRKDNRGHIEEKLGIEIKTWSYHDKNDLFSLIKDANKEMPKSTDILLVYIEKEDVKVIPIEIFEKLKKESVAFQEVFILMNSGNTGYFIFGLYPKKITINFDISEQMLLAENEYGEIKYIESIFGLGSDIEEFSDSNPIFGR